MARPRIHLVNWVAFFLKKEIMILKALFNLRYRSNTKVPPTLQKFLLEKILEESLGTISKGWKSADSIFSGISGIIPINLPQALSCQRRFKWTKRHNFKHESAYENYLFRLRSRRDWISRIGVSLSFHPSKFAPNQSQVVHPTSCRRNACRRCAL